MKPVVSALTIAQNLFVLNVQPFAALSGSATQEDWYDLRKREIFTRLKALGYEGGKTAVYDLVRHIRPQETKPPLVRFEGLPSEFSQHDFGYSSSHLC